MPAKLKTHKGGLRKS